MRGRKLKHSEVAPVRTAILKKQKYKCPLCGGSMTANSKKDPVLDHDHKTGIIRDVLCRNCNQMEGKIKNAANRAKNKLTIQEWLTNLANYWVRHSTPQYGNVFHPTHKTEEEKRLERNRKARARYKAKG